MEKFAVIDTGGKQYKVSEGSIIKIEKIHTLDSAASGVMLSHNGVAVSDNVVFDNILLLGGVGDNPIVGAPSVQNAVVTGHVLQLKREDKIIVFKKKRRQNYRRKHGHKQELMHVKITSITHGA